MPATCTPGRLRSTAAGGVRGVSSAVALLPGRGAGACPLLPQLKLWVITVLTGRQQVPSPLVS